MEHSISINIQKDESDKITLRRVTPGAASDSVVQQEPRINPTPTKTSSSATITTTTTTEVADEENLDPYLLNCILMRMIYMFILSFFAVSLDPLFLYIPIIDETNKCLRADKTLRNAALILRSLTDIPFLIRIINRRLRTPAKASNAATMPDSELHVQSDLLWTDPKKYFMQSCPWLANISKGLARRMPWLSFSFIVDFLAILPVPQVAVVGVFFKVRSSGYFYKRSIINAFLLSQYLPRIVRIYLYRRKIVIKEKWIKGVINFYLYILVSHIIGAIWYFLSIQRETLCWHQACKNTKECTATHYCDEIDTSTSPNNITFLNELCPIDPPNPKLFDFGNTRQRNFSTKFFYTLWWGFRNMSNFGTNLQTSNYLWENCFAILVSVIGLLLFLYLIGNVQTYMQLATTKSVEVEEEKCVKSRLEIDRLRGEDGRLRREDGRLRRENTVMKEREIIQQWMSRNGLPEDMKTKIKPYINQNLQENIIDVDEHVDVSYLFSKLSPDIVSSAKKHMGMNALKKVPMLEHMDPKVLEMMCEYLKPVIYPENSYIVKKGQQLYLMLIITDGIIWTWTPPTCSPAGETDSKMLITSLRTGGVYGEELLVWSSSSPDNSFGSNPDSNQTVKCHTKVHAFVLTDEDLIGFVSKHGSGWNYNDSNTNSDNHWRQSHSASLNRRNSKKF